MQNRLRILYENRSAGRNVGERQGMTALNLYGMYKILCNWFTNEKNDDEEK